jgi:hypothetical protein
MQWLNDEKKNAAANNELVKSWIQIPLRLSFEAIVDKETKQSYKKENGEEVTEKLQDLNCYLWDVFIFQNSAIWFHVSRF